MSENVALSPNSTLERATVLLERCNQLSGDLSETLAVGAMRLGLVYKAADELEAVLNPDNRKPSDWSDIQEAGLSDDVRAAMYSLRARFDLEEGARGIVKLTLKRQAPPPMRRRPVLQLQTQVTASQT
jgi:hypothetical protein